MTYFTNNNYLAHHGIKGMKWGIRRFRNYDGTLTNAGKKRKKSSFVGIKNRYKSGVKYERERMELRNKEHLRLAKSSKKFKDLNKSNSYLLKRYGLDADDGGGGYDYIPERKREAASRRYLDNSLKMEEMNSEFEKKSREYADKAIVEKYGDVALNDIRFKDNIDVAATLGVLAVIGGVSMIVKKH